MKNPATIKVAIIDDHNENIDSLRDHLSFFPDVEVCGSATRYMQARQLLLEQKPDLVFLDVEMPCKNGFELLNEVREAGSRFSVVFYTAYDKYMIQALRESAFDFILKPVDHEELKSVIKRFNEHRKSETETIAPQLFQGRVGAPEMIALPTFVGIRFVDINRILMFTTTKTGILEKPVWEAKLIDGSAIRLANGLSADKIAHFAFKDRFFQINQSCILNLSFLSVVEYKTHQCVLLPPFDKISLTISRSSLAKFKEKFEMY